MTSSFARAGLAYLARRRFQPFVQGSLAGYVDGWWLRHLCAELEHFEEQVRLRKGPRLMVMAPPRHGKSIHTSERFPAWILGRNPDWEIVITSYALKAALKRSSAARDVVRSEWMRLVFPRFALAEDTTAKGEWSTDARGSVYAVGVEGSLTSLGADVLIVDDPVKDWKQASSPTIRQSAWDWYATVADTRLSPGAGVLCIATRWHCDDLLGRLLERTADEGWRVVQYAAIAEGDEAHRLKGEPLHPERWPLAELQKRRNKLTSRQWGALFQQRPTTEAGEVWKREWWRHWTIGPPSPEQASKGWKQLPKRFDREVVAVDFSGGSTARKGSYDCFDVWANRGEDIFLVEEHRGRWQYPESKRRLIELVKRRKPWKVRIENTANGRAFIQELKDDPLFRNRLEPVPAVGSKESNAEAAAPPIEQGRVFLPDEDVYPWVTDRLEEVSQFPAGESDDRVDTTTMGVRAFAKPQKRVRLRFAK